MNKLISSLLAIVITVGGVIGVANAQVSSVGYEAIASFNSQITLNADNSVSVVETIIYDTGPQQRHGIYRDIYPYSSQNRKMPIDAISVTDENGSPYNFEVLNSGSDLRIKIGDPNQTFSGQKTYVVRYQVSRAAAQLKDVDEIYWNATGNEWNIPILQTKASIVLPNDAVERQNACYYGPKGSVNKCDLVGNDSGTYSFMAPGTLNAGEGLTVAVGIEKGLLVPYTSTDDAASFVETYLPWIISAFLPILTLVFSLLYWYKKGRDPKGTGVIVPQYDVPGGLTPMEVVGIVKEKVANDSISAEIIYLATKGYLKINQIDSKVLGLFSSTDYELVKLKDSADLPNDFDRILLDSLFTTGSAFAGITKFSDIFKSKAPETITAPLESTVKMSSLKDRFYASAASVVDLALKSLLNKGYYSNLGGMKNNASRIFLIMFMSIWASGFFGGILGTLVFNGNVLPLIAGIFLSIVIYGIISHFFPAKTVEGVALKEYLLGLKEYLQIAEKDRLEFHNAPEKRPEIFEKLLPYAMVLGVSAIWAKEFEGIYTTPPNWYSGPMNNNFSAIAFSNSISSFSSFASSSMTSTPGSSGGGSSGGGGGGGGGGGW